MNQSLEVDSFLRQVYSSLPEDFQMLQFNPAAIENVKFVEPKFIGRIIDAEMKRIKENCQRKEDEYVEQMLLENPIIIERRTNNNNQQQATIDDEIVDVVSVPSTSKRDMKQQRADSCRRSRYNNKVRKAKTMYRHKFMAKKLIQCNKLYDCIQDLITQTEDCLLKHGLPEDKLQELRNNYNMDSTIETMQNLKYTFNFDN